MSDSINISLRYGTEKHKRVVTALCERKRLSEEKMRQLWTEFEDSEKEYLAYMPETDADAVRRSRKKGGKPAYTNIKIPYSYATLLSAHTFWTSAFLSRSPVMQYTGRHGEAAHQVQAVEALVDYQIHVGAILSKYYLWMFDAPKYGFGVLWTYWANETKQISRIIEEPRTFFDQPIPGTSRKVKKTVRVPGYEGNRSFNVRPYDYIPDTRVPLQNPQDGEFVGRKVSLGWNTLVRGAEDKRYFNLDVVKKYGERKDKEKHDWGFEGQDRGKVTPIAIEENELPVGQDITSIGMNDGFEMIVELIPRDWKLGNSNQPEKWAFTVIGDEVVVEARPCGALHDKFPVQVLPMEFDAYSLNYRSMMDTLKPLNDTLDWLVNTHFFNVRASLNNQFVYDPLRVVTKDLTRETSGGRLIRLKESAYGTDVRSAIQQLPVTDVTQGHLRDSQLIADMIQRVSGVTDSLMGMMQQGGRKTATEVRTASGFGVNRLRTMSEYWSAVGFEPHGQMLVNNTQQYFDAEKQFKIAGDLMVTAQQFINVDPETIAGEYDFVPVDGTIPIDRYAQANLWREILMGLQKMPQIGQQYDLGGIFGWMARLAGLTNINQFKIQVAPDQVIQDEAAAGNVVPITDVQGPSESRPGQIGGNVGPTG